MTDRDDMIADALTAREPLLCTCGAECDCSYGLCADCERFAATLEVAA